MQEVPLTIVASARKESDSLQLIHKLFAGRTIELLNLLDYSVAPYSYSANYPPHDRFAELVTAMLHHQQIVFATPVYWYAMSAGMKTLFDRLTDLVTIQKPLGRQLKNKQIYMVAVGSDPALPPGFEVPFRLTAQYFGMEWKGGYYEPCTSLKQPLSDEAQTFMAHFQ